VAEIDPDRCIGCGECVATCPEEAIPIDWETAQPPLLEKTAEYALAAVQNKTGKVGYLNILLDIVPDCDCIDGTGLPFVPNLGMLASTDPVAIDRAAVDLILKAPPCPGSAVADSGPGDHLLRIHGRDYNGIFTHAERLGLGETDYELVSV
jgi:uncharacterized Fe-S center protein